MLKTLLDRIIYVAFKSHPSLQFKLVNPVCPYMFLLLGATSTTLVLASLRSMRQLPTLPIALLKTAGLMPLHSRLGHVKTWPSASILKDLFMQK